MQLLDQFSEEITFVWYCTSASCDKYVFMILPWNYEIKIQFVAPYSMCKIPVMSGDIRNNEINS